MRHIENEQPSHRSALPDLLSLGLITGGGFGLGAVLWFLGGPPGLPSFHFDWPRIVRILSGSHIPPQDALGFVLGLGWLALAYLAGTLLLRFVALVMVGIADGSAWARRALRVSDLVTLPLVRRAVDGVIAATLLASVWSRSEAVPLVEAAPAHISDKGLHPQTLPDTGECGDEAPALRSEASAQCFASYTVRPGDSLWSIARRFYGDGSLYPLVFGANEGRTVAADETLANPRVLRPGWTLQIPLPAAHLWIDEGQALYRVRPGDSLWGIAAGLLGDGSRWLDIWDLNRGRDMGDGRRFTEPGHINPGWVLSLPPDTLTGVPEAPQTPAVSPFPDEVAGVWDGNGSPVLDYQADHAPRSTGQQETPAWNWTPRDVDWASLVPAAAIGVGAAGIGVGVLAARRALRARGFTIALPRNRKTFRSDAGRVLLASQALLAALKELDYGNVELVLVEEEEQELRFTFDCAPGDAGALTGRRFDLGRRLTCIVTGEVINPTRVVLTLSRFRRLAAMLVDPGDADSRSLLVPVGAREGSVWYLNLAAARSIAVVGQGGEPWRMTAGWVAALTTAYDPEQVAFLADETAAARLGELARLPHFASEEPDDRSLEQALVDLEEALVARGSSPPERVLPSVLAVLALPMPLDAGIASRLEVIKRRGPELGIHVIAAAEDLTGDDAEAFGAIVGVTSADEEEDVEGPSEAGPVLVRRGAEPPLRLEPVDIRHQPPRVALSDFGDELPITPDEVLGGPGVEGSDQLCDEDRQEDTPEAAEPAEEPWLEPVPAIAETPADTGQTSPANGPVAVKESVGRQAALLVAEEEDVADGTSAETVGPLFKVTCFGKFRLEVRGREITSWKIQKSRELLAYLLARGGSGILMDEVSEGLWPEGDPDQVAHHLHNASYYLRRTLRSEAGDTDNPMFRVSADRYYLSPGLFRTDLDAFEAHLGRAEGLQGTEALLEYHRGLSTYHGDFLGTEPYEWAEPYRREYQQRFLAAAQTAAQLALDCRDPVKAVDFYQRILTSNPIDEEAARGLMTCYAKLGDLNGVRKVYKVLTEALRRDLDDDKAEPMPETTALFKSHVEG